MKEYLEKQKNELEDKKKKLESAKSEQQGSPGKGSLSSLTVKRKFFGK
jgi:hypothetical protein